MSFVQVRNFHLQEAAAALLTAFVLHTPSKLFSHCICPPPSLNTQTLAHFPLPSRAWPPSSSTPYNSSTFYGALRHSPRNPTASSAETRGVSTLLYPPQPPSAASSIHTQASFSAHIPPARPSAFFQSPPSFQPTLRTSVRNSSTNCDLSASYPPVLHIHTRGVLPGTES